MYLVANFYQENHIGPDEVIVQLEGTSMQSLVAKSSNFCNSYYSLFQIPREGVYRLKVVRLRKDFLAIKEIDAFPVMDYEVLVDALIPVQLYKHIPTPCHKKSPTNGYWISNTNPLSL